MSTDLASVLQAEAETSDNSLDQALSDFAPLDLSGLEEIKDPYEKEQRIKQVDELMNIWPKLSCSLGFHSESYGEKYAPYDNWVSEEKYNPETDKTEVIRKPPPGDQRYQDDKELNDAINEIMELLPSKPIWASQDGSEFDYPRATDISDCRADRGPRTNRQAWIVGNFIFFKRYTSEWDNFVMYGYYDNQSPLIHWHSALFSEDICQLRDLLKSKNPVDVTHEEVQRLLPWFE